VPTTVAAWVEVARAGPGEVDRLPGSLGRGPVEISTWASGTSGVSVVSYVVSGMGHIWPVGQSDNLDATTVVVRAATTAVSPEAPRSATRVNPMALSRAVLLHH
jgi:poly(3-hydroxybutyrate) depolymerase